MGDVEALNSALKLYDATGGSSFGSANTVHVSIPDTSAACANLGLPGLPSGWSYACKTEANYRKANGTGWVPVNFTTVPGGSPLGVLPVDPVNATSTGQYYTYVTGGSWELNGILESQKYRNSSVAARDLPGVIAIGTNLSLSPIFDTSGLVGYWKMDEGSGTTTADSSGNGNSGTLTNGPSWQAPSNCKVGQCLSFDGTNDHVVVPNSPMLNFSGSFTILAWVYLDNGSSYQGIVTKYHNAPPRYWMRFDGAGNCNFRLSVGSQSSNPALSAACGSMSTGGWHLVASYFNSDNSTMKLQVDAGGVAQSTMEAPTGTSWPLYLGTTDDDGLGQFLNGRIDDVRIYNRALSAAEIKAIYDATR